jgi:hypothetical protein
MIKLNVKISNNIVPTLKSQQKKIAKIPQEAYDVFYQNTPVRSGNARRNTKLRGKKQIQANYPYAERLDNGYSKQSPEGMIKPTEEFIQQRFVDIMTGKK